VDVVMVAEELGAASKNLMEKAGQHVG
jgi:hypothetical protein